MFTLSPRSLLNAPSIQAVHTLNSSSLNYSVLGFIGEGCFGEVAKRQNMVTHETAAIKIIKDWLWLCSSMFLNCCHVFSPQVLFLESISVWHLDKANVEKFSERFEHMGPTWQEFLWAHGWKEGGSALSERDWRTGVNNNFFSSFYWFLALTKRSSTLRTKSQTCPFLFCHCSCLRLYTP